MKCPVDPSPALSRERELSFFTCARTMKKWQNNWTNITGKLETRQRRPTQPPRHCSSAGTIASYLQRNYMKLLMLCANWIFKLLHGFCFTQIAKLQECQAGPIVNSVISVQRRICICFASEVSLVWKKSKGQIKMRVHEQSGHKPCNDYVTDVPRQCTRGVPFLQGYSDSLYLACLRVL